MSLSLHQSGNPFKNSIDAIRRAVVEEQLATFWFLFIMRWKARNYHPLDAQFKINANGSFQISTHKILRAITTKEHGHSPNQGE